jgi:hypothetical protein
MNKAVFMCGGNAIDRMLAELERQGGEPQDAAGMRRALATLAELEAEPVPPHKRGAPRLTAAALPDAAAIYASRREQVEKQRAEERQSPAPATPTATRTPRTIADMDADAIYASRARTMGRK